jgi:16S rRNA (cytosine967-C5)-methyltransferase
LIDFNENDSSRFVAAKIIGQWLNEGDFPDRLMSSANVKDRAFVMEIVYGIARWRRLLDGIIRILSSRQPDSQLRPYLLVGVYQIFKMGSVATHAAVYETVEAAKKDGLDYAAGFLNAVLRSALREKDEIIKKIAAADLGTRESHPDILINRWSDNFGLNETKRLCKNNNKRPKIILHPDLTKISMDDFKHNLEQNDIKFIPHSFAPDSFIELSHGIRVSDIPGYNDGVFSVQDPSTGEAVRLLDPQPGETILDACAAPGGKMALIADKMQDKGLLIAMDLHEDRLKVVRDNIKRMNLSSVKAVLGDAGNGRQNNIDGYTEFDRILIDVPCTNTGVIRRRPDARWRFSEERLDRLIKTQWAILCSMARFVKTGGLLVYSTCSLEQEEGSMLIKHWLSKKNPFVKETEIKLFPPDSDTDGIYAVALRKK